MHDQGWASSKGEVGWTWSDLVVKNVEGVEVHREQRVFVNPRANKQFQLHVKFFDQQSNL